MAGFGDLIRKTGLLSPDRLAFALKEQKRTGFRLGQVLVDHGIVDEAELFSAVARVSGFERVDMNTAQVDVEAARRIDPEWALEHRMMPLSVDETRGSVVVATSDPTQSTLLSLLSAQFGVPATLVVTTESELGRLIRHAYFNEPLDRTPGGSTLTGAQPIAEPAPATRPGIAERRQLEQSSFSARSPTPPVGVTEPQGPPPKGLSYGRRDAPSPASRRAPETGNEGPITAPSRSFPPNPPQRPAAPDRFSTGESTAGSTTPVSGPPPPDRPSITTDEIAAAIGPIGPQLESTMPPLTTGNAPPLFPPLELTRPPITTGAHPVLSGAHVKPPKPSLSTLAPVVELHQYTAAAIRAIFELCVARGIITREEYLARLSSTDMNKSR